jgi:polysaccharide biosynthesis protein PslG
VPGTSTAGTASTTPATTGAAPLRFGVVDGNLLAETSAQIDTELTTAASTGINFIREQLSWNAAEPQAGVYNWTAFDRVVHGVAAHHMQLLVLVDFTPSWARPAGCSTWTCAPAQPSQFAAFVAAASVRYQGYGVHDWEIWNEPNADYFWQPAPSAASYSAVLSASAASLRAVDPQAVVVSGGLAPEPDARGNIDPIAYLKSMCTDGALAVADAVGIHPYSFPVSPTYLAPWNAWSLMNQTTVSERSIMNGCGAGSKQIWATEFGAPTNGPGVTATSTNLDLAASPTHVDESFQALMATQAVQYADSQSWFGALFWYSYQDLGTATTTDQNFFGLVRYDGTHKPAFAALQAAIGQVTDRPQ